ncbi:hypothetical protein JB92DRAFT_2825123 [Gautieria morchelliformis]|nr:hypothetical protein JB92DRAFT_2825123 [Gautieria morchelliformis]
MLKSNYNGSLDHQELRLIVLILTRHLSSIYVLVLVLVRIRIDHLSCGQLHGTRHFSSLWILVRIGDIGHLTNATSTASPTSVVANSTSTTLATSAVANSTSTASATSAAANSTSTASANNTSCPLPGANGRRGLPALPNNLDLVLNGVTRQLQKNDDQGNSGDTVFQVVGTQDNGAFAKTPGAANANDFANEAALTDQVGQAIARGPDSCGRQWLVIKRAPGTPLQFTSTWQASIKKSAADCQADLANVIDKIVATAGQFVTSFGVMHNDLQPENVFFTDDLSSSTLIDWGRGTQVGKQFTAALQQTARQQATFSYRNLCDASQFGFRRPLPANAAESDFGDDVYISCDLLASYEAGRAREWTQKRQRTKERSKIQGAIEQGSMLLLVLGKSKTLDCLSKLLSCTPLGTGSSWQ